MVNIGCLKVGTKYGPEYVNRLAAMVKRNTTRPYFFFCATEDSEGIRPEIPILPVDTKVGLEGWWHKFSFIDSPFVGFHPLLYLDLDTVIVGNIDPLVDLTERVYRIAMLRDFYRPETYASGILSLPKNWGKEMFEEFWNNRTAYMSKYRGDQDAMEAILRKQGIEPYFFQDELPGQVVSYKVHCNQNEYPADARVVCFHGVPRPHQTNGWVERHWHE